jgi:hypothetical protein
VAPHRTRQALLLALRDGVRALRIPIGSDDRALSDRAAVAAHEASGLLLTLAAIKSGPVWWAVLRVTWAAARLYERAHGDRKLPEG